QHRASVDWRPARGHGLHRLPRYRGNAQPADVRANLHGRHTGIARPQRRYRQGSTKLSHQVGRRCGWWHCCQGVVVAGTDSPALNIHAEKILILDCGGPGTQLLARCVRAANVYCEIRAWDISAAQVRAFAPRGIILAGAADAAAIAHTRVSAAVFELGVPVLGIGLGMQVMATQLGGTIATPAAHEYSA